MAVGSAPIERSTIIGVNLSASSASSADQSPEAMLAAAAHASSLDAAALLRGHDTSIINNVCPICAGRCVMYCIPLRGS